MEINTIIKEQRLELEQIEKREKIIAREKLNDAHAYLKHPNILIITGIRRCGKSIFSYLLEKKHIFGYINFDDERLSGLRTEDLDRVLQAFYELYGDVKYIILDEIQNIPKWELFANRLRRTKKVIITGSNSTLLSGELATHLTGRHLDITLFPFSFREFLTLKDVRIEKSTTTKEKANILVHLNEYLKLGGFPEVYIFGKALLPKLYEDILTRDIQLRHQIKKGVELSKLGRYLLTNASQEITFSKLARIIGIKHVSTISNWISYFEQTFLIFLLERFDFKLKQQFIAPKKVYCIDTGMVDSLGFSFTENKGRILENAVAIELQRMASSQEDLDIYYWKNAQQYEVDFLLKKKNKIIQLIQVSYISSKDDIREREIKSLIKGGDALRCKNLLVLTWDYEDTTMVDGRKIHFKPLWKWLLHDCI